MSIRPIPAIMPPDVVNVAMCKFVPRCKHGNNCTYAHTYEEKRAWTKVLKRKRMVDSYGHSTKKARLGEVGGAKSNDDEVTSSSSSSFEDPQLFVETVLFKEFLAKIENMKKKNRYAIAVLGPKGFGKTSFLKQFKNCNPYKCAYVNLSNLSSKAKSMAGLEYYLIDNAESFTASTALPPRSNIIAAFSPFRSATKNYDTGYKCFQRACGVPIRHFYMRPFSYKEAENLARECEYEIVGNDDNEGFQIKKIKSSHFKKMYCTCNGNPSHMVNYLEQFEYETLVQDVHEEFFETQTQSAMQSLSVTRKEVNDAIINIVVKGNIGPSQLGVRMGLAYCCSSNGLGQFKPSSSYYVYNAMAQTDAFGFEGGLEWQRLESLTSIMLCAADVNVKKGQETISVPKANCNVQQNSIGEFTAKEIQHGVVTLVTLAPNHNIVDFIMFDRRPGAHTVYLIQTSSTNYSKKKKKFEDIYIQHVMEGRKKVSETSMYKHYTDFLKKKQTKFIYATTDLEDYESHTNVHFMDLLRFSPSPAF